MVELSLQQKLLRAQMTVMGHLFPERTAKQVVGMFSQTQRRTIPEMEKHSESLARIRKFPLAPTTEDFYTLVTSYEIPTWLQGYEYGPEDGGKGTIMLIHGYAGRAMQFYVLIPLLVARGYRVIGLDMPACGASPGHFANPIIFANALEGLFRANDIHPIALIGHSMGAVTNILFASFCRRSPYLDKLKCIANIGTQDSSVDVLNGFADMVGIGGTKASALVLQELEKKGGSKYSLDSIASSKHVKKINVPLLLVHDTQDKEVAVFNSRNIAAAAKEVVDERRSTASTDDEFKNFEYRYVETEGLGHQRILRDAKVLKIIVEFVEEKSNST